MATSIVNTAPGHDPAARAQWLPRLAVGGASLVCGAAIFIGGSYYFDVLPTNRNLTYSVALSALLLAATGWFKRTPRLQRYWPLALAFWLASIPFPFAALFDGAQRAVLAAVGALPTSSRGIALDKLVEMVLKSVPLLVLLKLAGGDFGAVYLKRGNWRLGIGIGGLAFCFLTSATFMFAAQRFSSTAALGAAVVWGLLFAGANGVMEELWLRGLFLRPMQPLLGQHGAVWVTAITFAAMHSFALYMLPTALPFYALNTLALGLGCGYLIVRSDSLWGAVVVHAASDFFLFMALLAAA